MSDFVLTEEAKAKLPALLEEIRTQVLRTDVNVEEEKVVVEAVNEAYDALNFARPLAVLIADSPIQLTWMAWLWKRITVKEKPVQQGPRKRGRPKKIGHPIAKHRKFKFMSKAFNQIASQLYFEEKFEDLVALAEAQEKEGKLSSEIAEHFQQWWTFGQADLQWTMPFRFAADNGLKTTPEQERAYTIMRRLGNVYMVASWAELTIVVRRPERILLDDERRLHSTTQSALKFRDGLEIFAVHDVIVPGEWISKPGFLTPEMALKHANIEQRRAAIEILTWAEILDTLQAKTIDKDQDPAIGELLEVELPEAGAARFLKVQCGTGRTFAMCVPREMKSALEANAWTYGYTTPEEIKAFKPEVRT